MSYLESVGEVPGGEDNIDVSGGAGNWDSFSEVDGGYGPKLSLEEHASLKATDPSEAAKYKLRKDKDGKLYYDKSTSAAFGRFFRKSGEVASEVAKSEAAQQAGQVALQASAAAATGALTAAAQGESKSMGAKGATLQYGAQKAASYAPAQGGCCGLTYAGAAEIYAERMGMPMGGTTGGGGAADDAVAGGGCCGFIGGSDLTLTAMRDYDKTINSVTKDQLVDDLVAALDKLGLKASGSSRSEKISSIIAIIPNQKKNGKSFKADAEQQSKVCSAIAKVINERYGRNVIDPDAEPRVVCQAVAEIANSLRSDIHMEFLVVHDEAKRVLKNMLLLKNSLEQMYDQINNKITNSTDAKLLARSSTYLDLHKSIVGELTRQITLLQNLIDVTLSPADVDIAKLLEDSEDISGLIQRVEKGPRLGTTQFGDVISRVLTELGVTAGFAHVVEKALKKVGVSLDEYAKSENLKSIAEKINKRLLSEDMKDDDLHEYLRSAELLYRNFYRAKDIARVLNKSGGSLVGEEKMFGGYSASYGGHNNGEVEGGECNPEVVGEEWKSGIDRRVEDKRIAKQIIFKSFNQQINAQFDGILKSLHVLADKIGSEIPVSDQLEGFRTAILRLKPILNQQGAFVALTGYYNDAASKQLRETFIAQLRAVNSFIEAIVEMSMYQSSSAYFRDIHSRVGELIKTVDQFSDRVAAKFGSGDRPAPASVEGGEGCEYMGGNGSEDEDEDESAEASEYDGGYGGKRYARMPSDDVARRTAYTVNDAITKFDYYYRIAQVKDTLKHSSKELEHYAENYAEIRGVAIAKKIDHARAVRDKQLKDLDDSTLSPYLNGKTTGPFPKGYADHIKHQKKFIKKFIEKQTNGIINFWRTVEAVDEYMRVFTDGIAKHPQDVKDIKDMLDETEVIYDAYDEETGNELVRVFEMFPNSMSGVGANSPADCKRSAGTAARAPSGDETNFSPDKFSSKLGSDKSSHYYNFVASAGKHGTTIDDIQTLLPGNPYLVVMLQDTKGACSNVDTSGNFEGFKHIRDMMNRFMILKNLLNVFIHIGSKFGGKELYRENFMKPTMIYRNLLEYLEISAFGMGLDSPSSEFKFDPTESGTWSVTKSTGTFKYEPSEVVTKSWLGNWWDNIQSSFGFTAAPKAPGMPPPRAKAPIPSLPVQIAAGPGLTGTPRDLAINLGATDPENVKYNFGEIVRKYESMGERAFEPGVITLRGTDMEKKIAELVFVGKKFGIARLKEALDADPSVPLDMGWRNILNALVNSYPSIDKIWGGDAGYSGGAFTAGAAKDVTYQLDAANSIYVRLGVAPIDVSNPDARGPAVRDRLAAAQQFGVYMRSVMPEFAGNECLQEVDQYFVRLIKSLCAKVLTTVGMYDVMQRPYESVSFDPVRMVLGAGNDTPQVHEAAVELYFRLPMLAEFYRDLFTFNAGNNNRNGYVTYGDDLAKITMLPEVDGVFSGLIKLVFRRGRNNKVGEFTDSEIKDLISEVNSIYSAMSGKHGDKVVMETIHEFVAEMNRRYGIVKQKDRDLYEEHFGQRYDYRDYSPGDARPINMPLLPGEEDMDFERPGPGSNPSLKYETTASSEQKRKVSPFAVKYDAYKLFIEFRCMLDNYFREKATTGLKTQVTDPATELKGAETDTGMIAQSFRPVIQSTKLMVKTTQDPNEKFDLVARMIRGSLTFESADSSKYLMFHETVVTGLNTLSAVHAILRNFQKKMVAMDNTGLKNISGYSKWTSIGTAVQEISKHYYGDSSYVSAPETDYVSAGDMYNYYALAAGGGLTPDIEKIYIDFVEQLYAISRDLGGMVDMRVTSSGISMNFSNLIDTIEKLFSSVKYFLDLLRTYIKEDPNPANDIIRKYTDKKQPGSYYWLQEQLLEKIVKGREAATTGKYKHEYVGLGQMQRKINSIFKEIMSANRLGAATANIAWWNIPNAGVPAAHDLTKPITKLFSKSNGTSYELVGHYSARYNGLYDIASNKFNTSGTIVLSFNDLLAKYLYQFYDISSEKIYKSAIDGFVNTFNQEIMNPSDMTAPNTLLDMSTAAGGWNQGGALIAPGRIQSIKADVYPAIPTIAAAPVAFATNAAGAVTSPKGSQILLESIAVMLKNIMSSRSSNNQSYIYMLDNVAEVSLFMKDRYKSNMPLFKNLFAELLRKAEFLKELLEKHEIKIDGISDDNGRAINNAADARVYVARVLANVVRGCMSMIACIDAVMREVADDPKYLETRAGSIADYKNVYGKEPIAPISLLTLVLRNPISAEDTYATLPFDGQGTSQSKFRYGTRGVLARMGSKTGIEQMPGFKKLVDMFNMTVNSKFAASSDKVNDYVENLAKLIRFTNEYKYYKGILGLNQSNMKLELQVTPAFATPANNSRQSISIYASGANKNSTYSIKNGYDASLAVVESSDQDGRAADICSYLAGKTSTKMDVAIRNIIDLNIVPINVNALMRDIPLVNLYNYEWTFNRMLVDLIFSMSDPAMASKIIQSLCAVTLPKGRAAPPPDYPIDRLDYPAQESLKLSRWNAAGAPVGNFMITNEQSMFASLLINPYREIIDLPGGRGARELELFHDIMSGRSMSGLSRPKFTSDQVYNKALLKQIYDQGANQYPGTSATSYNGREFEIPSKGKNGSEVITDMLQYGGLRSVYDIVSQLRLDTVLTRNLLFITDAYRVLRLKLRRDFMYNKDLIVSSHALTREDVTEFTLDSNKKYNW